MSARRRRPMRLPYGHLTTRVREYTRAWRLFNDRLVRCLGPGVVVIAFDPDVVVRMEGASTPCALPMWVARRIVRKAGGV